MTKLKNEDFIRMNEYFNALNYLSVGQLYLWSNPLLKSKLTIDNIKPKIVGHWGTVPAQNFIFTHLNRVIKEYDLNMMCVIGPGHGGEAFVAESYLEGVYSRTYPEITENEIGMQKLFKQFSFPKGISSHVAPETPGSINEGGELGYSLAHSYGAVLDNKDLIVACIVGDGEAETGPLQASWNISKLINPLTDGVVLPIVNLNGYKIANPTILGRMTNEELINYFEGLGYFPYIVEGTNIRVHKKMVKALDLAISDIKYIKRKNPRNPKWPVIVLKTPKGWTGPKVVNKVRIEGTAKSHQIPILIDKDNEKNIELLEKWMKSYEPEKIFNENGQLISELKALLPKEGKRLSESPYANGGELLKELILPNFADYAIDVTNKRGSILKEDTKELSNYIRDILKLNENNFRIFGPDELASNRLQAVFEETNRKWNAKIIKTDDHLSPDGRVIDSILSEHVCEGLLEGYLLTGRHGMIHSYEAFVRIVDSMASQHAKWLKVSKEIDWRKDISSLNYLLSSHIWQQDHNGFTHQDPGFLNHMALKKADTVRMYLPIDANTLISCMDHCFKTKNRINVVVASKHPSRQWLSMDEAIKHCDEGISELKFASNLKTGQPDFIFACCGDTPTLEVIAASEIIKDLYPSLKFRVINVIDLMKLQTENENYDGMPDKEYNKLFTKDKPIIFAFHGYPNLIHELTYKRDNREIHVHGYIEEGTITTPFDMRVQNRIDRYHLILDALKYLKETPTSKKLAKYCNEMLEKHDNYIGKYGIDMKEIREFKIKDRK